MKTPIRMALRLSSIVFIVFIFSLIFLGDAPIYPIALSFITAVGAIIYAIYDSKERN